MAPEQRTVVLQGDGGGGRARWFQRTEEVVGDGEPTYGGQHRGREGETELRERNGGR
ncbi:CrpD [Sesbania bispinosa]|nr:CrpD [Sesbania bispinosa]